MSVQSAIELAKRTTDMLRNKRPPDPDMLPKNKDPYGIEASMRKHMDAGMSLEDAAAEAIMEVGRKKPGP